MNRLASLGQHFFDVSETSRVLAHQEQGRLDAVTAYRSVLHFLTRLRLRAEEDSDFTTGLEALRNRLMAAGVTP